MMIHHRIHHLHGLKLHHIWIVKRFLKGLTPVLIKLKLFFQKLYLQILLIVAIY